MELKPIEFYFDLSSPYAYLTSTWIESLAEKYDRQVKWVAIMLGVAFQKTGMKPLFHQPLRGEYGVHDFLRSARLLGVKAIVPKDFPYVSLVPSRAFYWLEKHHPEQAVPFVKAAFRHYFVDGVAPTTDVDLWALCDQFGIDGNALTAGVVEKNIKQRLKDETEQAIKNGVFGAPFIRVDGEPFWGNDRKDQIEHWLKTGGW